MKIAFIHGHMFSARIWRRVAERSAPDGITLLVAPQWQAGRVMEEIRTGRVDLFLGELTRGLANYEEITVAALKIPHRLALGLDVPPGFNSFSPETAALFQEYIGRVSLENYGQGLRYLLAKAGFDLEYRMPEKAAVQGIYHPAAAVFFDDYPSYIAWYRQSRHIGPDKNIIALICHHTQLVEGNSAEIDETIRALEVRGLFPLCVFCEGVSDGSIPIENRYPWMSCLEAAGDGLGAVLNLLGGRFLSRRDEILLLQKLNVPFIQMVHIYNQTPEQWLLDPSGISPASLVYSLAQPEMAGVIEPTMAAGDRTDALGDRHFLPNTERIEKIVRRLKRWLTLRNKPAGRKKITFVLHNYPCKGLEANIGLAVGLETFQSLARVLSAMKESGYDVGLAPLDGQALLDLILEKKAVSEFRWTTVDEILRKGGALYLMGRDEYESYLASLPKKVADKILADWGPFPGEGMATVDNGAECLVITGLTFGNIKIMVQPKRGCYGAKCNGEVCRILHDPEISPPHHWLATYKYIQDDSDAVVHFGAEGALEYLPGKRAVLSGLCFPDISIGDLPNLYVYIMDMPGEGLTAKRRGRAVIVDHFTPVFRPLEMDEEILGLEALLDQYRKADQSGEAQRLSLIEEEVLASLKKLNFIKPNDDGGNLSQQVELAGRQIALSRKTVAPEQMHVLGQSPNPEQLATIMAGLLQKGRAGQPGPEVLFPDRQVSQEFSFDDIRERVEGLLTGGVVPESDAEKDLAAWIRETAEKISAGQREIPQLLRALDGEYIEPGLGGSLGRGQMEVLPTGRNFYATDITVLPTRAAWSIGRELADKLLLKYLEDEGHFPETVGLSLWSSDAFKSDGELFCQILHLIGARPVWDGNGKVRTVEAVPLDELVVTPDRGDPVKRPRVDILVQTSGVLRDMVPNFCQLLDLSVTMIGDLDEPGEYNYIRRHNQEKMKEISGRLQQGMDEAQLKRLAGFRVYSSAPGTYGLGVGLALDASAWETEKDLAEAYINWGGFAYGASGGGAHAAQVYGVEAREILAAQLQDLDVSYMKQFSPEYDLLDVGSYVDFQGGMAAAAGAVGAKKTRLYWTDSRDQDLNVVDLAEEIEIIARTKLFNRHWIELQKQNGYQGAGAVAGRVGNLFKWSATTRQVEKWVFDRAVEVYIRDKENLAWLRQANPFALEELTRRLLEAWSRKLWEADPELLAEVQSAALMIEGDMEERIGEVTSDFQGSRVEVMTRDQVEKWRPPWTLDKKS